MKPFLEVTFNSPSEIARKALQKGLQIRKNLEGAVAETVLLAVTRIAMDTPVDTGRARASIAGEFSNMVDMTGPKVSAVEVAAGKKQSLTRLNVAELEGVVGSNVEYIRHLEFGHRVVVKAANGRKYAKRDAKGKVRFVQGAAMFRKNIPAIRNYFKKRCAEAVSRGLRGEGMGSG